MGSGQRILMTAGASREDHWHWNHTMFALYGSHTFEVTVHSPYCFISGIDSNKKDWSIYAIKPPPIHKFSPLPKFSIWTTIAIKSWLSFVWRYYLSYLILMITSINHSNHVVCGTLHSTSFLLYPSFTRQTDFRRQWPLSTHYSVSHFVS